jgi:HK97 family phage major capsid protein
MTKSYITIGYHPAEVEIEIDAGSGITVAAIVEGISSVGVANRSSIAFVFDRQTLSTVRKLKDDEGRYVFNPLSNEGLFGFPVIVLENCGEYHKYSGWGDNA